MDCVFICICKTHAKTLLSWSSYVEVLLRLEDFLRTCNSACDWIQFESIRKIQTQRFRAKDASAVEWKSSTLLIKKLCGAKEKESSEWSSLVRLKVPGCFCLAEEERKKKINIMRPNCFCVSLSSSFFSLYPLSPSPSHPSILRQLLLCNQINCSPAAFGKCGINKRFASEV